MFEQKYYDNLHDRLLDMEADGCDLASWEEAAGRFRYARHPSGFPVFLPHDKISGSDEYADADPYGVEENISSAFQQRRIEITIELLQAAMAGSSQSLQVLDVGCGQGHITHHMAQSFPDAKFSALDYSVSAIEYAHDKYLDIDFAVGDAYDLPYAPGFFDVIVCNNLWEHVPDPLFLLGKMKQCLKPRGYVIISTPSRYRTANLIRAIFGRPVVFMSKYHVTEYTVGQVKEQLRFGGFDVVSAASRPAAGRGWKENVARKIFSTFISVVGSHHQLESTIFYLARAR